MSEKKKDPILESRLSEKINRWISETENVHTALKDNEKGALIDVTPKFKSFVNSLSPEEQQLLKDKSYITNEFTLTNEGYHYLLKKDKNI